MGRTSSTPASAVAPQSVERIFAVLGCLALRPGGESLSSLARAVSAPKTSLLSLLTGMVEGRYLVRTEGNIYTLGPRAIELAARIVSRKGLVELAHPVLVDLAHATGETVLLGTLEPGADVATYIDKVESANPLRYTVPLGTRRALYASAIGKLLLAYAPDERIEAYLETHRLLPLATRTITRASALRADLKRTRERGLAITEDEGVAGASALAAPVFDAAGDMVAGVVIAGPTSRIRTDQQVIEHVLRQAAGAIGRALGAPGDSPVPASDAPEATVESTRRQ